MKWNIVSVSFAFVLIVVIGVNNQLLAQTTTKKLLLKGSSKQMQIVSKQTKMLIRDSLFKVYYQKYQAERVDYQAYGVKVDTTSYGAIELNYTGASNENLGPETIIPAFDNFIEGDLNNDQCNDLIVSIYHSQNGRPRLDIYCYVTTNKQLQLYTMYTGRGLGICKNVSDTSGRFFPAKIVNGQLIGGTDCYKKNDPGCCPSLEMITTFKFNNGLKFVKQVKKP